MARRRGVDSRLRRSTLPAGKPLPVNSFLEDARNLLGQSSMFGGSTPAQRLFQMVGHIRANENSFTIRHFCRGLSFRELSRLVKRWNALKPSEENRSVSRILYSDLKSQISNLRSEI